MGCEAHPLSYHVGIILMPPTWSSRLDGWKEIAAFLRRDVTTAIRWETQRGLPVHRLPGGHRSAVYAYPEEISRWLESGDALGRSLGRHETGVLDRKRTLSGRKLVAPVGDSRVARMVIRKGTRSRIPQATTLMQSFESGDIRKLLEGSRVVALDANALNSAGGGALEDAVTAVCGMIEESLGDVVLFVLLPRSRRQGARQK